MLFDRLAGYAASGIYPMHMPGHKRNAGFLPPGLPYDIDITEISGFDDLHDPRGVLLEAAELAAGLYGSDRAFLLVNGSTVGILAAIGAHTARGDKILVVGNCHRSVHNAAALFGLEAAFMASETDEATGVACSVDPAAVESILGRCRNIKLVVVTSPSYEGVVSDVGLISQVVHKWGAPLLVDSAHGAHLGFSSGFPVGAVQSGADVVVMSLHKTLPALTQCSLLHICSERANADETARLLSVLQTSSPSYVLMASIDRCLRLLASEKDRVFAEYEQNLAHFGKLIKPLKNLRVICHDSGPPHPGFYAFDPGKITIVTKNTKFSGSMLADTLRADYKIELELACADYAIAMTSICDSKDGFNRLADALVEIDHFAGL